jgi:hypothetical protein
LDSVILAYRLELVCTHCRDLTMMVTAENKNFTTKNKFTAKRLMYKRTLSRCTWTDKFECNKKGEQILVIIELFLLS